MNKLYSNNDLDEELNNILNKNLKKKINKLVLSGGGIKAIAHIGALKALEETNILPNIKTILGCSSGALIALLYIIGYTVSELYQIIIKFNFEKIKSKSLKFDTLISKFGLDNGEHLIKQLSKFVKNKKMNSDISFKQLYKFSGINLIINATCLNDKQCYFFSHISHPDMSVILAVRMSTAFPIFFTPVEFGGKLFTDGGCSDNFPIHIFEKELNTTLGIYLDIEPIYKKNINDIETYLINMIDCIYSSISQVYSKNYNNVIKITINHIGILEFKLTELKKYELYIKGYNDTINFLNKT